MGPLGWRTKDGGLVADEWRNKALRKRLKLKFDEEEVKIMQDLERSRIRGGTVCFMMRHGAGRLPQGRAPWGGMSLSPVLKPMVWRAANEGRVLVRR